MPISKHFITGTSATFSCSHFERMWSRHSWIWVAHLWSVDRSHQQRSQRTLLDGPVQIVTLSVSFEYQDCYHQHMTHCCYDTLLQFEKQQSINGGFLVLLKKTTHYSASNFPKASVSLKTWSMNATDFRSRALQFSYVIEWDPGSFHHCVEWLELMTLHLNLWLRLFIIV
jgi:hypothetical protein